MLGLLPILVLRTLLLALTLVIFLLAARRLAMSKSANAWLYAATALFALLTLVGLLPWIMGLGKSHPVFFVFAAATPAVWYGVVTMCNATRQSHYDSDLERTVLRFAALAGMPKPGGPLLLTEPVRPDAPVPVFRHAPQVSQEAPNPPEEQPLLLTDPQPVQASTTRSRVSEATKTLLGIARNMRKNSSSEGRRPKLLPAPKRAESREIPFLRARESV